MDTSHLLQLWLDGDLDVSNEQQLFAELASDSALREEMHDLLALREVVAMDHSAYVPSDTATRAVFERLGFTPPAASPLSWFGKYKQGILSSTTTAAIMLLLFLWDPMGWGPQGEGLVSPTLAGANEQILLDQVLDQGSAQAEMTPNQQHVVAEAQVSTPTTQRSQVASQLSHASSMAIETVAQSDISNSQAQAISQENATDFGDVLGGSTEASIENSIVESPNAAQVVPVFGSISLTPTQEISTSDLFSGNTSVRDRVHTVRGAAISSAHASNSLGSELLDVRHSSSMPLISTRVDAEANSLNGFSAIYWRARSHKFWFGLAAGQEAVYQEYGHKRDDGRMVSMAQFPSVFWYGAAARYYLNSTLDETPLYSEMILAANRFGPMTRLSLGAQWSPYQNLTLQAGIDGQLSFYNHQQRLYTTPSLGLSYGVVFKF